MRSVWSTLVAVALVVAGARASGAQPRAAGHSELHAAKCLHVVAPAARRAHRQVRVLDALVTVARIEVPAVSRGIVSSELAAEVSQPVASHLFVRSSRGPPPA
jgi:hypothetical protein